MAQFDLNRLYTQLLNSGLQTKDPSLYQVIHQLIGTAIALTKSITTISVPSKTTIIQSIISGINPTDDVIFEEPIIKNISAIDVNIGLNGGTLADVIRPDGSWRFGTTAPTQPVTGAGALNPVRTGQVVIRLESLSTGATQGGFLDLACNTGGIYNTGVELGNVGGNFVLATNDGTEKLRVGTALSTFLSFGGQTTSFPAIKRSSAALQIRLADDSGFAELDSLDILIGASSQLTLTQDSSSINVLRVTGAGGGSGTQFFTGNPGSGSSRNWAFVTNFTAFGMIELMVSTASGSSAYGAPTVQSWTNAVTTLADAINIAVGTTTGTKIGTLGGASGQKLGFFNATPIVQPLLATGAAHTVDDVITTLQNLGLCRQT